MISYNKKMFADKQTAIGGWCAIPDSYAAEVMAQLDGEAVRAVLPQALQTRALVLDAEELCYAFSRQVPDSEITLFQQGLTRALASEEFRKLQAKYLPVR